MVINLITPYWHSVVSTKHKPILAALKDGNHYEVAGKRVWPADTCNVIKEGTLSFETNKR